MSLRPVLLVLTSLLLIGCDQLGIATPAATAAKRDADAKAIGGACRHAGRAIEDCYTLNRKADKSAVYAGWREMEEYMRENKLEAVAPVIKPEPPGGAASAASRQASDADDTEHDEEASADASPAKGAKSRKGNTH